MKSNAQWIKVRDRDGLDTLGEEITTTRQANESLWEHGGGSFRLVRHSYEKRTGDGWVESPESLELSFLESQALFDQGYLRGAVYYRNITSDEAMREVVNASASSSLISLLNTALDRAGVSSLLA